MVRDAMEGRLWNDEEDYETQARAQNQKATLCNYVQ